MDTGNDFDQCALAAAVLAREAMNFAAAQFEVHMLQRMNAAEVFRHSGKFQDRRLAIHEVTLQTQFGQIVRLLEIRW